MSAPFDCFKTYFNHFHTRMHVHAQYCALGTYANSLKPFASAVAFFDSKKRRVKIKINIDKKVVKCTKPPPKTVVTVGT